MIIKLEDKVQAIDEQGICNRLLQLGYRYTIVQTQYSRYIVAAGKATADIRIVGSMPGVADIHHVTDDYQLVSRQWKVDATEIDLGDGITIGERSFSIMAGPCSVESEAQIGQLVTHLVKKGIRIMRGGVFKPRSSPYSFRGLGIKGLRMLSEQCRPAGIRIISEVMEPGQIDLMYDHVDVFQVGTRNAQNFNLLDALGKTDKPVLLKRGMSSTIDELLQGAEYIFSSGNERLILCERGIRTFETAYRNTFDINAIPLLKEKSHLPVIADPAHGTGIRRHVQAIAIAAAAAGADGVIYEVQEIPETAVSDAQQTLNFEESASLIDAVRALHSLVSGL